jgi:hypothetical protein
MRRREYLSLRLPVKGPDSKELSERFSEVQSWIAQLIESAKFYRIEWKKINHRIVGTKKFHQPSG